MKHFSQYFNALFPAKQRRLLIVFVVLFALLLLCSLCYNQINIKPGYAPKFIGRSTDPLTKKK